MRAAVNVDRPIGAWMDAQRQEVFAALYAADGRLEGYLISLDQGEAVCRIERSG